MTDMPVPQMPHQQERCDARDLLARLYREIGISAVAAALHVSPKEPPAAELGDQTPSNPPLINRLRGVAA